jgi:peptidoglycan LD-endopeptidase CwlK
MNTKYDGLHPKVAELAETLIVFCLNYGIKIDITRGFSSIEAQNRLYAQGRTSPGNIVTNAKGGESYHNYGLAFDIVVLKDGVTPSWDRKIDVNKDSEPDYNEVGEFGEFLSLEWGGRFKSIIDLPHFQYTFGLSIRDLKNGKKPPVG